MKTPYYLIDIANLEKNLEVIDRVRKTSGCKCLLALKCFSTWPLFNTIREHMDGATCSSLNEVKLAHEQFGLETQAYSVAYDKDEFPEVLEHANKIIFNSVSQLKQYKHLLEPGITGLRINPGVSSSPYTLADPCVMYSRLGEGDMQQLESVMDYLSGFMIHNNCDNHNFESFLKNINYIEQKFGYLFHKLDWISLGGGVLFTASGYPVDAFCQELRRISDLYGVQIYLEPGEAVISGAGTLEVSVLDIFRNQKNIAIVDSSIEAHLPDLLIYRLNAEILPNKGEYDYLIGGNSCLAGDVFGEFKFAAPLHVGDRLSFINTAGYSMVKKNWFNGLRMPSVAIKNKNGETKLIKRYTYEDFKNSH